MSLEQSIHVHLLEFIIQIIFQPLLPSLPQPAPDFHFTDPLISSLHPFLITILNAAFSILTTLPLPSTSKKN